MIFLKIVFKKSIFLKAFLLPPGCSSNRSSSPIRFGSSFIFINTHRELAITTFSKQSNEKLSASLQPADLPSNSTTEQGASSQKRKSTDIFSAQEKRQIGGRVKNAEKYALFDTNDPRRAPYVCCAELTKSVVWNSTRGKDHFLKCKRFQSKFPAAFEDLGRRKAVQSAVEVEKTRRARETTTYSPQTRLTITTIKNIQRRKKLIVFFVTNQRNTTKAWSRICGCRDQWCFAVQFEFLAQLVLVLVDSVWWGLEASTSTDHIWSSTWRIIRTD